MKFHELPKRQLTRAGKIYNHNPDDIHPVYESATCAKQAKESSAEKQKTIDECISKINRESSWAEIFGGIIKRGKIPIKCNTFLTLGLNRIIQKCFLGLKPYNT